MERFKNVDIVTKANIYYDGKVTSRTVYLGEERKTLGFMMAGEYVFNTQAAETMEVLGGSILVKQNGQEEKVYKEGEVFHVPANSSFTAVVETYADYCCSYGE